MKTAKKPLTAVFATLALACFLLCGASLTPVFAEPVSAEGGFYMQNGAAIRLQEGESGIRFSTTVTEEFYLALQQAYGENAAIEFHTVIGEGENFSGENDYVWEGVPSFGEAGEYVYKEVIYYDDVEQELTDYYESQGKTGAELETLVREGVLQAYATELNARAYVKVTPESGETVTIDAVGADTLRSMRGVALNVLVAGAYEEEEKPLLESYLGGEIAVNEAGTLAGYYDAEGTGTLAETFAEGTYEVYSGAKKAGLVVVSADGETVSVNGLSETETVGSDYPVTLYNAETGNAYVRDFKYVSKVIDEANDLAMFKIVNTFEGTMATVESGLFDGYYVLGKDIDATGYTHINGITRIDEASSIWFDTNGFKNCGLTGTFDGNGHTISNMTINRHGLFGVINGGTVKNIGFENLALTGGNSCSLAYYTLGAVIENVYLDIASITNGWSMSAVAASFCNASISNLIIEVGENAAGAASFTLYNSNDDTRGASVFSDVYIVSSLLATPSTIDGENRDCENTYTGIKRYDTLADMIENKNYLGEEPLSPNDYSSFTESGCWHLSEDGIPVFGAN